MAKGEKPAYRVFVTRAGNNRTFYTEVGAAWHVNNGGISIQLHSLPVDDKLVTFPPKSDDMRDETVPFLPLTLAGFMQV